MDLQHLRASDGTGEAVLAHVQSVRNIGSTVLDLDNVDNWNSKCIVVTGTPAANGYIAAAGMTIMYGHITAGDFIIDGYAPGYADNGNSTTEIAIVKMTTSWADFLVDLLAVHLQDNGKLKVTALDDFFKPSEIGPTNFVASGGVVAQTAGLTGSFSDIVYYINGLRYTKTAVANKLYTASKDTYVDIGTDGVVDYNEVANGAAAPALAASHIRIAKVVTSGAAITSVTQSGQDSLGNLIYNRNPHLASQFFWADGQDRGNEVRSNLQVFTMTVIPNISGNMHIDYRNDFGFAGSNNQTAFRIKINGNVINGPTNGIFSNSAQWNSFAYMSKLLSVVAGTTYTITVEATNAVGCYIQNQQMAVTVHRT